MNRIVLFTVLGFGAGLLYQPTHAQTLIGEEQKQEADIPEEILETEIILDGRSPIDGQHLSPAKYAQLEDRLRLSRGEVPGRLSPKIHRAVVLLRLRKLIGTLFPFLF